MPRNAVTAKPAADAPEWAAQLTPREQRFVSEYIIDLNATEAAIRAGLGKTRKSATEIASRIRRKSVVAAAISALITERSGATGSRIIEELGKLAFADVTDIVKVENGCVVVTDTDKLTPDQRASIAEISETIGEGGRTIKVKMHDKIQAIDKLAKVLSLYRERVEVTGRDGGPVQMEDAKARLAAMLGIGVPRIEPVPMTQIQPPPRRIAPPSVSIPGRIIDAE
jgi:phage terminase small subunit